MPQGVCSEIYLHRGTKWSRPRNQSQVCHERGSDFYHYTLYSFSSLSYCIYLHRTQNYEYQVILKNYSPFFYLSHQSGISECFLTCHLFSQNSHFHLHMEGTWKLAFYNKMQKTEDTEKTNKKTSSLINKERMQSKTLPPILERT